jgi:hypothetical protein
MGWEKAKFLLLAAAVAALAACGKPSPPIVNFALPDGFTGPIVVLFGDAAAPPPPAGTTYVDVPGDGIVATQWDMGAANVLFHYRTDRDAPLPQVPLRWTAEYASEWEGLRGRAVVYGHTVGSVGAENRAFVSFMVGDIAHPIRERQDKLISDVSTRLPVIIH